MRGKLALLLVLLPPPSFIHSFLPPSVLLSFSVVSRHSASFRFSFFLFYFDFESEAGLGDGGRERCVTFGGEANESGETRADVTPSPPSGVLVLA